MNTAESKNIRYKIQCLFCDEEAAAVNSKKQYCSNICRSRHYTLKIKKDTAKYRQYQERRRLYSIKNKAAACKRHKDRYHSDINYRLQANLRTRLHSALKRNAKTGSAVKDLGCSIEFFKNHLEKQFTKNMNWDNYSEWHIDHIIPLSSFDLTDKNQLLKACHYSNLQPLWAKDNIIKRDSVNIKEANNARSSF